MPPAPPAPNPSPACRSADRLASPVPVQMRDGASPVPSQTWQGERQSSDLASFSFAVVSFRFPKSALASRPRHCRAVYSTAAGFSLVVSSLAQPSPNCSTASNAHAAIRGRMMFGETPIRVHAPSTFAAVPLPKTRERTAGSVELDSISTRPRKSAAPRRNTRPGGIGYEWQ